ncbi:MAG TPA: hypothetical protein PKA28_11325 [Methylomusa anaerophila]|uniref:Uncharacterized protein n=1 Tax=Methylomusa anaerophila TaxID=1930071 RepID=A0A348AJA0_9FIRM|nr:hypothetical protein [Methylomusa anaerophila]BBB91148.1 hypothetical protein MAMMFC1_01819 [Methylomusa anaerophila]HML89025.1 hypothetical protein [Methylomusa anaerophila]
MNIITHTLTAIFDFFCGDWRIFWGVAVTCILVELVEHLTILTVMIPFLGIIYITGISLSLIVALQREVPK